LLADTLFGLSMAAIVFLLKFYDVEMGEIVLYGIVWLLWLFVGVVSQQCFLCCFLGIVQIVGTIRVLGRNGLIENFLAMFNLDLLLLGLLVAILPWWMRGSYSSIEHL
jgi:hypothetical protein